MFEREDHGYVMLLILIVGAIYSAKTLAGTAIIALLPYLFFEFPETKLLIMAFPDTLTYASIIFLAMLSLLFFWVYKKIAFFVVLQMRRR